MRKFWKGAGYWLLTIACFVLFWEVIKALFFDGNGYFPHLREVLVNAGDLVISANAWHHISSTVLKVLLGFCIALLTSVPMGVVLGAWAAARRVGTPLIDFFRSVPASALIPVFILWFGLTPTTVVAMVWYTSFFLMLVNIVAGMENRNPMLTKVAHVLQLSRWETARQIHFFEVLPYFFIGARVSISYSLVVAIVAEMFLGQEAGIGAQIYVMYETLNITPVFAWILVLGTIGYLLNLALMKLESSVVHWRGSLTGLD